MVLTEEAFFAQHGRQPDIWEWNGIQRARQAAEQKRQTERQRLLAEQATLFYGRIDPVTGKAVSCLVGGGAAPSSYAFDPTQEFADRYNSTARDAHGFRHRIETPVVNQYIGDRMREHARFVAAGILSDRSNSSLAPMLSRMRS